MHMTKDRLEFLLAQLIERLDNVLMNSQEYIERYKTTYDYLKSNTSICDYELKELGVDIDCLKINISSQ